MVQEGIVLGHLVSSRGIEVDPAKIDVKKNLPPPTNFPSVDSIKEETFLSLIVKGAP